MLDDLDCLTMTKNKINAECNHVSSENKKLSKIISELEACLKKARCQIDIEAKEKWDAKNKNDVLKKQVQKLKKSNRKLNAKINKEQQLFIADTKKVQKQKNEQVIVGKDYLESQLDKLNNKLDELNKKNANLVKNFEIHLGISCNGCKKFPLIGKRYNCFTCKKFNFCEFCYKDKGHTHKMARLNGEEEIMITPQPQPQPEPRLNSNQKEKLNLLEFIFGATQSEAQKTIRFEVVKKNSNLTLEKFHQILMEDENLKQILS